MIEITDIELIKKFRIKHKEFTAVVKYNVREGDYYFDIFDEEYILVKSYSGYSISEQNVIYKISAIINKKSIT
jgi:hypothetical protein